MSTKWPNVRLGEVLTERKEVPSPNDLMLGRIKILEKIAFDTGRIHLRTERETKTGMIQIRPGELVVSGINAAKGAIAAYAADNTEPVAATIHYGSYIPKQERVMVEYLWWLLRSRFFQDLLLEYVPGGIKTELKAKRFLPIPVPLPSLAEQRRIVARIEELAAQINEARILRQQGTEEIEAFIIAIHVSLAGSRSRKLGDILQLEEDQVPVSLEQDYPQAGLKGFGGGLFSKTAVSGTQTTYRTFNRLFDGALILSQVKGWEGAVAVCDSSFSGQFVSPEYRTFRCNSKELLPDYLAVVVSTEWFWSQLRHATRGVGARRERTRPEQFLALEMPIPDVRQQPKGVRIFRELRALKRLQAETASELDALLPSILDKAFKGGL
ncbi:MAG: restriction endonuclease subunit S [Deltaproteobacteria bacterium]|nr:restriction endonuclease subunit S [Deltaproteobacteria bacterium]